MRLNPGKLPVSSRVFNRPGLGTTLYIFIGQTGAGQLVTDYNVEKNAVDLSAEPWVLSFLGAWSDFIAPLYFLNNSTYWPMTLAVYNFFGQFQQNWSLVSADILLTILPVLLVYVFAQRFILSGLISGAVKG
jgi:hypothetical protein